MDSALFGAVTPDYHSLLTLALMPLGLLLACALVAGMGAILLLFSRASASRQAPEREPAPPAVLPPAGLEADAVRTRSAPRAGVEFVERRKSSTGDLAEAQLNHGAVTDCADPCLVAAPGGLAASTEAREIASLAESRQSPPALTRPNTQERRRASGAFQLGGRFARSQQAFLRIPVVLSAGGDAATGFREETCTLILLPQGAVLPLAQPVAPGTPLSLSLAGKEPVTCSVFGAQTGPDGKSLVEIEFSEPRKDFWPVSFPAWAGELPTGLERKAVPAASRPAHTAVLNESGS